ncbi:unnamed protein product [Rotaria socialis]|uniref:Uncharacterized protein n=1 Tax=Rotaria socialis TaxID=392032 RepID=A0A820Q3X3_9BILA|nr:unnamed protein product [Rotaria socialis]CAF4415146.1 unnamed protein product [Rotaria socialis]
MNANNTTDGVEIQRNFNVRKTFLCGINIGAIAYSLSFSVVPIVFTITAIIFGKTSEITIIATALSQLAAGYLHTYASRVGMARSVKLFGGIFMAKPEMTNRRTSNEDRKAALKRFFCQELPNAIVLNVMWQTFTINYLLQSLFILWYIERFALHTTQHSNDYQITDAFPIRTSENQIILIHGVTRFVAGCIAGMSTGVINQFWQRYQYNLSQPGAIFMTNKSTLKINCEVSKKILTPCNVENWIKLSTMILSALFTIMSSIPNNIGFYQLSTLEKRLITDIMVIQGGWFFIRDFAMIILMPKQPPEIVTTMVNISSPAAIEMRSMTAEDSALLTRPVDQNDEHETVNL